MRTWNTWNIGILLVFYAATQTICAADDLFPAKEPGEMFAERMAGLLVSAKETSYQHLTEIDEKKGVLRCDCSGLVGFVLRHDFPEAYVSLRGNEAPWRKRPVSVTYYETFVAEGNNAGGGGSWRRVTKLMDVVPGDVLAWRKKMIKRGSTTGHTCMIAALPQKQSDGTVRVRIIDSTRKPHANDTRPDGTTGVGAGEKTFFVNEMGRPVGYLVGDRRVTATIAVGRLVRPVSPGTSAIELSAAEVQNSAFIGLGIAAAGELAEAGKLQWRVIREDGKPRPVKWLIRVDRLNFVVEKGKVVRVIRG